MTQGYGQQQNWQHSPQPGMAPMGAPAQGLDDLRKRAYNVRRMAKVVLILVCVLAAIRLVTFALRVIIGLTNDPDPDASFGLVAAGGISALIYLVLSCLVLLLAIAMTAFGVAIAVMGQGKAVGGGIIVAAAPPVVFILEGIIGFLLALILTAIFVGVSGGDSSPRWLMATVQINALIGMFLVCGACFFGQRMAANWARSVEQS